jgi:hypothetical protein
MSLCIHNPVRDDEVGGHLSCRDDGKDRKRKEGGGGVVVVVVGNLKINKIKINSSRIFIF